MKNSARFLAYFITLNLATIIFSSIALALPQTCTISLLNDSDHDAQIVHLTNNLALDMGTSAIDASQRVSFFTSLYGTSNVYQSLRTCLEGEYEEVIIVAHSREEIPGKPSIMYFENSDNKDYLYINDRFFKNVSIGAKLKVLTLVICQASLVINQYLQLKNLLSLNNIKLKLAPISPFATWALSKASGRELDGVVPLDEVPNLIAESLQQNIDKAFFCYIYQDPLNPGEIICNKNKIKIYWNNTSKWQSGWGYFTFDTRNQTWWLMYKARPGSTLHKIAKLQRRGRIPLVQRDRTSFGSEYLNFEFNIE